MRISVCLTAIEAPDDVSRYLVRLWVPGAGRFATWRTAEWWLDGVTSADEAIAWARDNSDGSPAEVFLPDSAGMLLRIWGEEPADSYTTVTIELTSS